MLHFNLSNLGNSTTNFTLFNIFHGHLTASANQVWIASNLGLATKVGYISAIANIA